MWRVESRVREKAGAEQGRAGRSRAGKRQDAESASAAALVLLLAWLSMWLLGGRQSPRIRRLDELHRPKSNA